MIFENSYFFCALLVKRNESSLYDASNENKGQTIAQERLFVN